MERERITIIIPAYNSGRFIADAVQSVLAQSVPPEQIIVVDDGSTDDTEAKLRPYLDRITLINQANQGAAVARNAGLQIATGDFIAFLDADDVWHRRKLEAQLGVLRRRPDIQMLGTETYDYPNTAAPGIAADAWIEEITLESLLVRNYFTTSSIVIRREIVDRLGGFDKSVPTVEDFDYWQRVAQLGVVAILKSALTGYRRVPGSVSSRPDGVERGIRRIMSKLDEQDAWRGRHWLRRKAISHLHYSVAYLHGAAGRQGMGLWEMIQSLAWYPFPYCRREAGTTLGRARRTMVLSLRLLGLMRPEAPLAAAGGASEN
jgi:glycosyltransferase involved in cell wall biosynthesis